MLDRWLQRRLSEFRAYVLLQASKWHFHPKLKFLTLSDFTVATFLRDWVPIDEEDPEGVIDNWKPMPLPKTLSIGRVIKDAGTGSTLVQLSSESHTWLPRVFSALQMGCKMCTSTQTGLPRRGSARN